MNWTLQDAKNSFSKVVKRARTEGAQIVTLRGDRAAVVLSIEDYDRLSAKGPSLVDHLLAGEAWDDDLVSATSARAKQPGRKVSV